MAKINYFKSELQTAAQLHKSGLISYFERLYIEKQIFSELYRLTLNIFFKNNLSRVSSLLTDYAPVTA